MSNGHEGGAGGAPNQMLELLQQIQQGQQAIAQRLETIEADQATLMGNDEKLNARIDAVAAMTGGVSPGVGAEQLQQLQRELEDVKNNPMLTRDPKKIKERHKEALRRAGEREREAGVHSMWHPELNPAKRIEQGAMTQCRIVRTMADREEALAQGYLKTLDEAAAALLESEQKRAAAEKDAFEHARKNGLPATAPVPAKYKTLAQARVALHLAEQRVARGQVASQPAAPIAVVAAPAAGAAA